jgi:hypothetical protein
VDVRQPRVGDGRIDYLYFAPHPDEPDGVRVLRAWRRNGGADGRPDEARSDHRALVATVEVVIPRTR